MAKKTNKNNKNVEAKNDGVQNGLNQIAEAIDTTVLHPDLIERFSPMLDKVAARLRKIGESYQTAFSKLDAKAERKAARLEKAKAQLAKYQKMVDDLS